MELSDRVSRVETAVSYHKSVLWAAVVVLVALFSGFYYVQDSFVDRIIKEIHVFESNLREDIHRVEDRMTAE